MNNFTRTAMSSTRGIIRLQIPQIRRRLFHHRTFSTTFTSFAPHTTQPVGLAAVIQHASNSHTSSTPRATIFDEFALPDRVAIVTGGNQNLGLEQALALSEAGARAVYCIDLPSEPSEEWNLASDYIKKLGTAANSPFLSFHISIYHYLLKGGRLEYISADVTNQKLMWDIAEKIGDKEGRVDICIAGAAILGKEVDCLEYSDETMDKVMAVNVNGALYTAQAAGRQMTRTLVPSHSNIFI